MRLYQLDFRSQDMPSDDFDPNASPAEDDGGARQREGERERAHLSRVLETIQTEVIPRLVLAHASAAPQGTARAKPGDVEKLVEFLVHQRGSVDTFIEQLEQGRPKLDRESIFMDLLAPAARRLGVLWEEDEVDFTMVTMALIAIQATVRNLSHPRRRLDLPDAIPARRALLATVPGEQHTLGISLAADFLYRSGWEVEEQIGSDTGVILSSLENRWFAAVGISISTDRRTEELKELADEARAVSCNPSIRVMLGGALLFESPDRCAELGGDCTASTPEEIVTVAEGAYREGAATFDGNGNSAPAEGPWRQ